MLFKWTAIALFISAAVLGLLTIPISRMMRGVGDETDEKAEPAGPPVEKDFAEARGQD